MQRLLVLLSIAIFCFAQIWQPGATGYTFLKLGVGVRPVAMGNAFTALSDDGNAVFWNPAGLGVINSYYVSGMGMYHLDFIQYYNLTSSIYLGKKAGALGVGLSYLTAKDTRRDEYGQESDEFRNSDMLLNCGYGKSIGKKKQVSFGGSGKIVRSQLESVSAYGVLGDFGFILHPVQFIYLGTTLKNLGTPRWFIEKWEYPPVNFRQGLAIKIPFRQNHWALSFDYSLYPDYVPTFSIGSELQIREPKFMQTTTKALFGQESMVSGFSLMVGYQTGYQDLGWSGFSFGFLIEIMIGSGLFLDIGAVALSYGYLGYSERIGIGLNYTPELKKPKN
ncbi:MAG: PorV/PorQ family protein [candidate division WOR-3 bacterium]